METQFKDLLGKTLIKIDISDDKDRITLTDSDEEQYLLSHRQDCCENVMIEDICGDIDDLIGEPLTMAEESTNSEDKMGKDIYESFTWTFYKLATTKGYVTIRWLGESNGYYSESVNFNKI